MNRKLRLYFEDIAYKSDSFEKEIDFEVDGNLMRAQFKVLNISLMALCIGISGGPCLVRDLKVTSKKEIVLVPYHNVIDGENCNIILDDGPCYYLKIDGRPYECGNIEIVANISDLNMTVLTSYVAAQHKKIVNLEKEITILKSDREETTKKLMGYEDEMIQSRSNIEILKKKVEGLNAQNALLQLEKNQLNAQVKRVESMSSLEMVRMGIRIVFWRIKRGITGRLRKW